MFPIFPNFKAIELADRDYLHNILWQYQPEISELTFTNLYIWRNYYGTQWSIYRDWLLILSTASPDEPYALPPIGSASRIEVCKMLLNWLKLEKGIPNPYITRADKRLVDELQNQPEFSIELIRDQFDYLYRSDDLIKLSGSKLHGKKNHLNKFLKTYSFTYAPLKEQYIPQCLTLAESWCELRHCAEDLGLHGEWEAVKEILYDYPMLSPPVNGAVILINEKVEAFTLGEQLNERIAVIHIEKANPAILGLYAAINQQFCEQVWQDAWYINREQDLGDPGLRQAKLSYQPTRLVEKYQIRLL